MTIFGLNFLQKTANRDFVKILRFAVSVFLNFYCGSVLVRFGLDTLVLISLKTVFRGKALFLLYKEPSFRTKKAK